MSGRIDPYIPAGEIQHCQANRILGRDKKEISTGSIKRRVCFAELPFPEYRIASHLIGSCFSNALPFTMIIQNGTQTVWLNIESLRKRFKISLAALKEASESDRLDRLIETVKIRRLAKQAQRGFHSVRFSKKKDRTLRESVTINPNGFVAIDMKGEIGSGGNATIKLCRTLQGTLMVRRICRVSEAASSLFAALNRFKNTRGVLHTFDTSIYANKHNEIKAVSFHPLYEGNLLEAIQRGKLSERDKLEIALDTLIGLSSIEEEGVHGDLRIENILFRKKNGLTEAVIADFDFFNFGVTFNHRWAAPEFLFNDPNTLECNAKMDVWPLGAILFFLFQRSPQKRILPSIVDKEGNLAPRFIPLFKQELIDEKISEMKFDPKIETLLKGMLTIDPEERWTAREALDYFQHNCRRLYPA